MASHFKRCRWNNAQRSSSADQISVAVAASEIIGCNADLVVEILRRLPPKSVLRFKSVSKAWLSLISSSRFCLLHWQQQHPQSHDPKIAGLFLTGKYGSEFIKYIPLIHSELKNGCNSSTITINAEDVKQSLSAHFPDITSTVIEDSRNGFVLLYLVQKHQNRMSYHVYNPTTKKLRTLPGLFYLSDSLYMIFDPLKSPHYKVVLLKTILNCGAYSCYVHIYSSQTHAWRAAQPNIGDHHPFRAPLSVHFGDGVYCNGSIHWISFSQLSQQPSLYFDVDQERFCPMPSAPFQPVTVQRWYFGESRGHLHLIEYCDGTGFNANIFEMESDYSKWSLKYRVRLNSMMNDLIASKPEMVVHPETLTVLGLIHGEDDGDVFLVIFVDPTMIISYNIKDNTFKKLDDVASLPVSSPPRPSWRVQRNIENIFPI
ncbi:F-box protein At5g07610-like [Cornus florida]|uniref:F-box protein At5g07610-like n=1 Tax=Cornus florida TaxID=4283 RepID=UPI00289EF14F|nr:F-box protein At5g07610-like [Cornus florida]